MSMVHHSALDVYTQIETYTVTAEHQQAILDELLAETNRWVSHQPGFLTAHCYPSEDGRRVVSQVEWRTHQDWHNVQRCPEQHVMRVRMRTLPGTTLVGSQGYTVPNLVTGPMEAVLLLPWNEEEQVSRAAAKAESVVVLLQGNQTNHTLSMVGMTDLPYGSPPLHVHTRRRDLSCH